MNFGVLSPEINSGRMYTGSGSGPMLVAAAAWDGLAIELHDTASAFESTVGELSAGWLGPSALAMATAAVPYTAWLQATAVHAEVASTQIRSAAAAYETAFAATVPPPLIAANRSLLLTLIATNLLGQNTPAIAATEAHYLEMWAQDAAAMYAYAGAAAAAALLPPFTEPSSTADSADLARPSTAGSLSRVTSAVPNALRNLTTTVSRSAAAPPIGPIDSLLQGIANVMAVATGPYSPVGWFGATGGWWLFFGQILALAQNPPGVASLLAAPKPITGAFAPISGLVTSAQAPASTGLSSNAVNAAMTRAGLVGQLSVPQSWAANTPTVRTVAAALSSPTPAGDPEVTADDQVGLFSGTAALSGLTGRAMNTAAARSVTGAATRTIGKAAAFTVAPDTVPDAAGEVTIIVVPAPSTTA